MKTFISTLWGRFTTEQNFVWVVPIMVVLFTLAMTLIFGYE